jgi:hypothetical protein
LWAVLATPDVFQRLRPKVLDLLCIWFLVSPIFTSISNGFDLRDGLSSSFNNFAVWCLPYILGRAYLVDLETRHAFVKYFIVSCLLLLPLYWVEVVMSPQLHRWVYGYSAQPFIQSIRFGAYRPALFFSHGLEASKWLAHGLTMATSIFLMKTAQESPLNILIKLFLLGMLFITLLLTKSSYIFFITVVMMAVVIFDRLLQSPYFLLLITSTVPTFIYLRIQGTITGEKLLNYLVKFFGEDRIQSVAYRFLHENLFLKYHFHRPWLGWAGYARNNFVDPISGITISTYDSAWIVQLSIFGINGLLAFYLFLGFAYCLALFNIAPSPNKQGVQYCLAVFLGLTFVDSLLNTQFNLFYPFTSASFVNALSEHKLNLWKTLFARKLSKENT